jgi:hypothetical protein
MRQPLRSHLTFANVVSLAALFVALGGTATAVTYVVSSNSQVGPGTIAGHKPPRGKHANIIAESINGKDIADRSGVDTCQSPLLGKFGPICAGSDGGSRTWSLAISYCTNLGLRLPSYSEALQLAKNYDVPGVPPEGSGGPYFWTDSHWQTTSARTFVVDEDGLTADDSTGNSNIAVCVTDPSA